MDTFAKITQLMQELFPDEMNAYSFEDFKKENGISFWWASDLMTMLDYRETKSFQKAIDRATKACITLNIPHHNNFIHNDREQDDGTLLPDLKLTRFACYLIVMNADSKKPSVAAAQVYFATQTRKFELYLENSEHFDRILIRDEIKDGNKSLSAVANQAGVTDYARFCNAGFLGMYNMLNVKLAEKREIPASKLYDYMGRTEFAANLFRITQTEEKIKNDSIKGQTNLEAAHMAVGKQIRKLIIQNTGKTPEQLPKDKELPEINKELKRGYKNMLDQDKKNDK